MISRKLGERRGVGWERALGPRMMDRHPPCQCHIAPVLSQVEVNGSILHVVAEPQPGSCQVALSGLPLLTRLVG